MRAIFESIFSSSNGLGSGRSSIISRRTITKLSLETAPFPRHLKSGDDPGNEYKRYNLNLVPRAISLAWGRAKGPGNEVEFKSNFSGGKRECPVSKVVPQPRSLGLFPKTASEGHRVNILAYFFQLCEYHIISYHVISSSV